jgi:hypothetical protein
LLFYRGYENENASDKPHSLKRTDFAFIFRGASTPILIEASANFASGFRVFPGSLFSFSKNVYAVYFWLGSIES